jgi:branched-chain amino acid aminotransferase
MVFLNGKFIPVEEAKISLFQAGFLYGWGIFETMRAYKGKIVYFNEHLKRLESSSKLIKIKIPYSLAKIKSAIQETVDINGFEDAYVKLNLWKSEHGSDISVTVKEYDPYPAQKYKRGFHTYVSQTRNNEGSFLSRIKSHNYLLYQLAYLEAKNKGFDEAIILNNRGYITEASRSNVFLVKDGPAFTPSLSCGCLEGITRRVILDLAKRNHIEIFEGNFTIHDLYGADEAFLTNSLMGVMPINSIERQPVSRGKITKLFMTQYNSLLRNGI